MCSWYQKVLKIVRIALLTKYGNQAASTRHRFYQYQNFLEQEGFDLIKLPLFKNSYLKKLYKTNRRNVIDITTSYFKRLRWLLSKPDVDVIWLHCDLFPYMPGFLEKLVTLPKKPIIFDFDDAIFHNYDLSQKWFVRKFLGSKLHDTIGTAKLAFCGNDYLANYVRPICSNINIIPTVINTDDFIPNKQKKIKENLLRVGWLGTPTTFKQYVYDKIPLLKKIAEKEKCQIHIMGSDNNLMPSNPYFEDTKWCLENEIKFVQSLDIGIMPLNNSPWSKGKCGFKLIQYMACGLPVVASPVGVNRKIVEHGVNGFLAVTDEDWYKYIRILLNNKELRYEMGVLGRKKIEKEFSIKVWGPKVSKIFANIAKNTVKN